MWDYIIDIHPSKLLCTKTKESKINEHKKIKINKKILNMDNLHFLPKYSYRTF